MSESLDAVSIFNSFVSRRDFLRRTGQLGIAAGLPVGLAACVEIPDNAFRELATGEKQIAISEGRNCWGNQCFQLALRQNKVSVAGRETIDVPEEVDLRDGFISESEFDLLLSEARKAYPFAGEGGGSAQASANGGGSSGSGPGNTGAANASGSGNTASANAAGSSNTGATNASSSGNTASANAAGSGNTGAASGLGSDTI